MEQKTEAPLDRLGTTFTSWKEIAHYLGVNVRTAQKWEKERHLPVRRLPSTRGRVISDSVALDRWMEQVTQNSIRPEQSYRWPLGANLAVEVRFSGGGLTPRHIDLLGKYLELLKVSLS